MISGSHALLTKLFFLEHRSGLKRGRRFCMTKRYFFEFRFDFLLDLLNFIILSRRKDSYTYSFTTSSSGPTRPVNVGIQILWRRILNDQIYVLNIKSSRSYICCNQAFDFFVFKIPISVFPLKLRNVTVNCLTFNTEILCRD